MNIFGRPSAGRAFARPASLRVGDMRSHGASASGNPVRALFERGIKALSPSTTPPTPSRIPRPALSRGFGTVFVDGDWPQNYEAQVREAYLKNAVAQRAVRLIAEGVGALPVKVNGSSNGDAPDPAAALALLNATSAGQVLIEAVTVHLLLHGNAFIQLITDSSGALVELFALRPERVKIESDARGWPLAYVYRVGDSITRIKARDAQGRPGLVHIKGMHPLDDHYGLGCLGAASGPIATHNAATKWNKQLLDNMARPSGALVYEPGEAGAVLSTEQFDRLREEIDAHFSGPANAGRPLLLEGGLKWQALSLSPSDMDFINLKAACAREIALAFGVPPALLGLPGDATYNNYREASRALYRSTILPTANKILAAVAEGMQGWWPDVSFSVELDSISALADDREKLWTQIAAAPFLSDDEKRAMLGLQPGSAGLTPDFVETEI